MRWKNQHRETVRPSRLLIKRFYRDLRGGGSHRARDRRPRILRW